VLTLIKIIQNKINIYVFDVVNIHTLLYKFGQTSHSLIYDKLKPLTFEDRRCSCISFFKSFKTHLDIDYNILWIFRPFDFL